MGSHPEDLQKHTYTPTEQKSQPEDTATCTPADQKSYLTDINTYTLSDSGAGCRTVRPLGQHTAPPYINVGTVLIPLVPPPSPNHLSVSPLCPFIHRCVVTSLCSHPLLISCPSLILYGGLGSFIFQYIGCTVHCCCLHSLSTHSHIYILIRVSFTPPSSLAIQLDLLLLCYLLLASLMVSPTHMSLTPSSPLLIFLSTTRIHHYYASHVTVLFSPPPIFPLSLFTHLSQVSSASHPTTRIYHHCSPHTSLSSFPSPPHFFSLPSAFHTCH